LEESDSQKKISKTVLVMVILILVLLFLGVWYYLVEKIDTSDWQTYTDNDYNFIIRYPQSWHLISDPTKIPGASMYLMGPVRHSSGESSGQYDLDVDIIISKNRTEKYNQGSVFKSQKKVKNSGILMDKQITENFLENRFIGIYFVKDSYYYSIEGKLGFEELEKNEQVFNQIISFFKFIE